MAVEKAPVPSIGWTAYTVDKFHLLTTMLAGPSDVLIKLNVTGLCLTDVHFMMNDWAFPKMSEMGLSCAGHEGAGVIVKIGESVKSCKVGQRAAYGPIHSTCSLCEYCKSGRETYCQQAVYTGGTVDGTLKKLCLCMGRLWLLICKILAGTYKQYCAVPEGFVHVRCRTQFSGVERTDTDTMSCI